MCESALAPHPHLARPTHPVFITLKISSPGERLFEVHCVTPAAGRRANLRRGNILQSGNTVALPPIIRICLKISAIAATRKAAPDARGSDTISRAPSGVERVQHRRFHLDASISSIALRISRYCYGVAPGCVPVRRRSRMERNLRPRLFILVISSSIGKRRRLELFRMCSARQQFPLTWASSGFAFPRSAISLPQQTTTRSAPAPPSRALPAGSPCYTPARFPSVAHIQETQIPAVARLATSPHVASRPAPSPAARRNNVPASDSPKRHARPFTVLTLQG